MKLFLKCLFWALLFEISLFVAFAAIIVIVPILYHFLDI